jgi:predicted RNA-binding Zn ribbon-like protein
VSVAGNHFGHALIYYQHATYAGENSRKLFVTCQVVYDGKKMKRPSHQLRFDLTAGCLCLDFANTVDKRLSSNPEDKLSGYEELVAFGKQTGVFSPSESRKLQREGRQDKNEASILFQQAVDLREMIFRILSAVAVGHEVSDADAGALNDALQKLNTGSLVVPGPAQGAWRWVEKSSGVARLLGRIVRSAVEALTSDDIGRVKRCAAEKCCWLFMDRSRSRNRRWCEMRTCGSQHKAKAYYNRKTVARKHGRAATKLG